MTTASKAIIGVCVLVPLVVGLSGTFDYAQDRARRADSALEGSPGPTADPLRVERGRRPPDLPSVDLRSKPQVVDELQRAGFDQAIVLKGGRPTRLTLRLAGEDGTAARTYYDVEGRTVSIGQVRDGVMPLTGTITKLTPSRIALEVRGVYYLSERGYIVTIGSNAGEFIDRLRWQR